MLLHIEPNSDTSIYRQIVEQVRGGIAGGQLQQGDQLPSLRQAARDLVINYLTVKQAYDILEREGLIETRRGRGTFICANSRKKLQQQVDADLEQRLREAAINARRAGLKRQDFHQLARRAWDESENPS